MCVLAIAIFVALNILYLSSKENLSLGYRIIFISEEGNKLSNYNTVPFSTGNLYTNLKCTWNANTQTHTHVELKHSVCLCVLK